MAEPRVSYSLEDAVAVLRMDDGKANALSHERIMELHECLDRAEREAGAVLLVGREGCFSGGFDLKVMGAGPKAAGELVMRGADLLLRMAEAPLPLVAACTGHALAAGALLLLASDLRVGAQGAFRIGLNEVAIGMTLPGFARALARERLARPHLMRAAGLAEVYAPDAAREAGFLDAVVPPERLLEEARREAARLAALPRQAFAQTKRALRRAFVARVRAETAEELGAFTGKSD
jgi:enoyl-CoA hydratase